MEGLRENLEEIFKPMIQSCEMNLKDVLDNQEKLSKTLNRINEELLNVQKSNYLSKDEELGLYLERLVQYKKRLSGVSSKIDKLQSKMDKVERRFMHYIPKEGAQNITPSFEH